MTARPTVIHFLLDNRMGGPHRYVETLVRVLEESVESHVVVAGQNPMANEVIFNWRGRHSVFYAAEVPANVARIIGIRRRFGHRADVLFHVHGSLNVAPIYAAALSRTPVIWHLHETLRPFPILTDAARVAVRATRYRMAAVGQVVRDRFGLGPDALVLRPPIDAAFWSRHADTRPAPDPVLRVAMVANLNPLKGHLAVIEALESLRRPWRLDLMGAKLASQVAYANDVEQRARDAVHGEVRFHGWLQPEEHRRLLSEVDCFILGSNSEGVPLALLEAMAAGVPSVATPVGEVPVIAQSCSGLIASGDTTPAGIATAVSRLLALDLAEMSAMRARARRFVTEECDCNAIGALAHGAYLDLLRVPDHGARQF